MNYLLYTPMRNIQVGVFCGQKLERLDLEDGEDFVDDKSRPEDGFDDAPDDFFEAIGELDVVDKGSDETHAVESVG